MENIGKLNGMLCESNVKALATGVIHRMFQNLELCWVRVGF